MNKQQFLEEVNTRAKYSSNHKGRIAFNLAMEVPELRSKANKLRGTDADCYNYFFNYERFLTKIFEKCQ